MSDTPRTEAVLDRCHLLSPHLAWTPSTVTLVGFARELERELADLKKTNAMLADNWAQTERLLRIARETVALAQEESALVPDLAMLVKRLAGLARPACVDQSDKAIDFLKRYGLYGLTSS